MKMKKKKIKPGIKLVFIFVMKDEWKGMEWSLTANAQVFVVIIRDTARRRRNPLVVLNNIKEKIPPNPVKPVMSIVVCAFFQNRIHLVRRSGWAYQICKDQRQLLCVTLVVISNFWFKDT